VGVLNKENMGDDDDDRNYYAGLFVLLRALLAGFQFSTYLPVKIRPKKIDTNVF
jgi:hypothetical protein